MPWGGGLLPWCGKSGSGRSPTPDRPSFGRADGARYPLAVGAGDGGVGTCHPTQQPALLRAGFACCGGGTRAPRGGRLLPGCGASGSGCSPTPDRPSFGRAAGARYPLAVGAGGVGMGTCHLPPLRALLPAGFVRCGGGTGAPGWGAYCLAEGSWGLGALPGTMARPSGVRTGPATHWWWVRGVWTWGPATYPTARALVSWL